MPTGRLHHIWTQHSMSQLSRIWSPCCPLPKQLMLCCLCQPSRDMRAPMHPPNLQKRPCLYPSTECCANCNAPHKTSDPNCPERIKLRIFNKTTSTTEQGDAPGLPPSHLIKAAEASPRSHTTIRNTHAPFQPKGKKKKRGSSQLDGPPCIRWVRTAAELYARPSNDNLSIARFFKKTRKPYLPPPRTMVR